MDVVILIFLCFKIGKLAVVKGLPRWPWIWRLVGFWLLGELLGGMISFIIFGPDLFPCFLLAIAVGAASYFIIDNYLSKLPDSINDNINNIGQK